MRPNASSSAGLSFLTISNVKPFHFRKGERKKFCQEAKRKVSFHQNQHKLTTNLLGTKEYLQGKMESVRSSMVFPFGWQGQREREAHFDESRSPAVLQRHFPSLAAPHARIQPRKERGRARVSPFHSKQPHARSTTRRVQINYGDLNVPLLISSLNRLKNGGPTPYSKF